MALKKTGVLSNNFLIYACLLAFGSSVFFGNKIDWMFGRTPPWAIVTPDSFIGLIESKELF